MLLRAFKMFFGKLYPLEPWKWSHLGQRHKGPLIHIEISSISKFQTTFIDIFIKLGLENIMINWWKKWIDFVKINSIWMKILNDIACNLNWIHFEFNLIQILKFKSNTLYPIQIQLRRNGMQIGAKILKICSWLWCFVLIKKTQIRLYIFLYLKIT
jgi:hypothetical protein